MKRSRFKAFYHVQRKSKIPVFERERIDVVNHSNPDKIGISRIGHIDPT